ncbi:type IV pilin N-terminal domain-containing protein [Haloarcula salinisoli]|uniref:Type IV pilin N-terminal domain-containing protein n=1 Tax=Haloarcula salinisoli TaxID=2487746 RepID=A0A8J7YD94_9EURY|nr:type IV pilin N-terminal domain-containing protein [Halomicroarcula salinisoli]MBX0303307.1 type IV pilin N-terminal domain-containing protein [Halomicroarcula salinisoli]
MWGKLFDGDGEVSQVVGATLLIAISILLAVTTAAFVIGLGDRTGTSPPEVEFTYEYSQVGNGNLTIVHESGETLDPSTVEVRADIQFRPAPGNDSGTLRSSGVESYALDSIATGSEWVGTALEQGSEFTVVGNDSTLNSGTIRIVWVGPADGDTTVLGEWQGPGA